MNEIFPSDCMEFMRGWKGRRIDVIVTSPPYNLGKDYTQYKDNKKRTDYISWLGSVAEESKTILNEDGSFFLNMGGRPSDPFLAFEVAKEFRKHYCLQNVIHWIKHVSIPKDALTQTNALNGDISFGHFKPINTNTFLNQCQEYIFHFTKTGKRQLDKLAIGVPYQHKSNVTRWTQKKDIRDRGNVWFIRYENKQGGCEPILHPTLFPEKLPHLCIRLHGIKKGMLVYDPFIGIGTTALACIGLGVDFIGTEIDKAYIKIANKRIEKRRVELNK